MASVRARITSTPSRSNTPASTSSMVRFTAVCPPSVGSRASGRSRSMMAVSRRGRGVDIGAAAVAGSVMIVAGFELASTTR